MNENVIISDLFFSSKTRLYLVFSSAQSNFKIYKPPNSSLIQTRHPLIFSSSSCPFC